MGGGGKVGAVCGPRRVGGQRCCFGLFLIGRGWGWEGVCGLGGVGMYIAMAIDAYFGGVVGRCVALEMISLRVKLEHTI